MELVLKWRHGVVVITTAQLYSTEPELRFCAGSNPARGMSEIRDSEDLWQWSRLEIRLNAFRHSTILQKQFIIKRVQHNGSLTMGCIEFDILTITFILIKEIGFTKSLLNLKTLTGPVLHNYLFYMSLHRLLTPFKNKLQ